MSQQLINLSPDLKRLRDEGYEVEVYGGYLLVHHIPYLANNQEILFGTLVCTLSIANGTRTIKPDNHVIHFIGENPCNLDGSVISSIQHNNSLIKFCDGLEINRSFSNKPPAGYPDYFQKVKRYADIISAPAKYLKSEVTEKTFKVIPASEMDGVFAYIDTNSSRANIEQLNYRFLNQKIAIIGLGGTGAYVLDLVAKTPVSDIFLYDGDSFDQHNAFRSPGAASISDLDRNPMKADYFKGIYSMMHKGIVANNVYITALNLEQLDEMSYVFICVDKNTVRKQISNYLVSKGISFIDVGLGVNVVDDKLIGAFRTTSGTFKKNDHLQDRIFGVDNDENDYATNIQIAELNSLNAGFAVIKWKKLSGFYVDLEQEHHSSYSISVSKIFNEDVTA